MTCHLAFKQAAVDNKAVRIGAYRQPVNAAVLIHIVGEIVVVDCARLVGHSEIHQAALKRRGIMQRYPPWQALIKAK